MVTSRRNSPFAASMLLHVAVLALLWLVGVSTPVVRKHLLSGVLVYTPPPLPSQPKPVERVKARTPLPPPPPVRSAFRAPDLPRAAQPKIQVLEPAPQLARAPSPVSAPPPPVINPAPVVPVPRQVQLGAFETKVASIAAPPPAHAPSGAAGFDSQTAPGAVGSRPVMAAGAFDSAASGTPHAARGPVRSGGFGAAFDPGTPAGPARKAVAASGFGDASAVAAGPRRAVQTVASVFRPVEILQKPKPAYTEEARRLGIEGEVVLEALFTASGEIRVLRTIRGLGHGLDENAQRAAQGIRFRPAERDGQPVDFTASVHIIFQLAN